MSFSNGNWQSRYVLFIKIMHLFGPFASIYWPGAARIRPNATIFRSSSIICCPFAAVFLPSASIICPNATQFCYTAAIFCSFATVWAFFLTFSPFFCQERNTKWYYFTNPPVKWKELITVWKQAILTHPYWLVVKDQVLAHQSMDAICRLQLELAWIMHSFMVSEAAMNNCWLGFTVHTRHNAPNTRFHQVLYPVGRSHHLAQSKVSLIQGYSLFQLYCPLV